MILTLLFQAAIFADVKAGSKCPKLGKDSITANKKYTCIKSGLRLVWNKGVPMATTTNIQNQDKISNPSPSVSNKTSTTTVDAPKGNYEIASKVFNEINNEYLRRKSSGIEPELFISPNFNKKFIDVSMVGIYKAMDFWSDVFKPDYKMPVFFVNPTDKAWFNEVFPKRIDNPTFLNHFNNVYSFISTSWGSGDADSDIKTKQNFIVYVYTNDYKPNFGSSQIGAHEYTHNVQHTFNIWNNNEQFPCWAKEGQAMLFGMVLAQPTLNDYLNVRYKFYQNTPEARTDLPQNSPNWVTFFTNAEQNKMMCANGGIYEAGALAFEYLFSLKGKKGMIEFLQSLEAEEDFDIVLLKVFGQKKIDLYRNFGNYIESQLIELRKNN